MTTEAQLEIDAALGPQYKLIEDIIRMCDAEDSSGLRRALAQRIYQDIKDVPQLIAEKAE